MDWIIENVLYLPFLTGAIFMIAAAITHLFPPKSINYLYGYRTSASMKTQKRWDFAQQYSTLKMFQAGVVIFAASFVGLAFPNNDGVQLGIGFPVILCSCIFMFFTTERALRKKFPNN
jgi:uncharacterized membrane protein